MVPSGFASYIFKRKNLFKLYFGLLHVQVDVTNWRISHLRDMTLIRCFCFHQNDETMNKFSKKCFQMIVRSCVAFCSNAHKCIDICTQIIHNIFSKWFFLDSCLVLCECCGQFEGLASCVESPLTSSSPSNTYKILQLFYRTTIRRVFK